MDKKLRDWTLGEIKEFCESLGPYSHSCDYCPFSENANCVGKIIVRDLEKKENW